MRAIAQVESDGSLTIDAEVLRSAGFAPGDEIEVEPLGRKLLLAAARNLDSVFERYRGIGRLRPPMSMQEIIAEQREMRGHDDFEVNHDDVG